MFAAGKIITRNVARANGIDVTGDVPGKIITRSVTRANQIETNATGAVKRKANIVIIKNGTMLKRQTTAMNQNAPVLVENRQQIVPRKVVLKAEPTATITSGAATQTTNQTFSELQRLEDGNGIVSNTNAFDCGICFKLIRPNDGVIFRNCLHNFCKDCVIQLINQSDDVIVKCPYTSDDYQCSEEIQHREIRALLTNEQFHKFLNREINFAEINTANSFHCKLPNCPGWCECDENVNNFCCPVCKSNNCINCGVSKSNNLDFQQINCYFYFILLFFNRPSMQERIVKNIKTK